MNLFVKTSIVGTSCFSDVYIYDYYIVMLFATCLYDMWPYQMVVDIIITLETQMHVHLKGQIFKIAFLTFKSHFTFTSPWIFLYFELDICWIPWLLNACIILIFIYALCNGFMIFQSNLTLILCNINVCIGFYIC